MRPARPPGHDPRRRRGLLRLVAAAPAFALLATSPGCGFRPRGSTGTPDAAGSLYVDADRGLSVLPELREALVDRGLALAPNRDDAALLLRVGGERVDERIVSVQRTGRVSEYELSHEVSIAIGRGEPPAYASDVAPNLVRVTRDYTWDVTEVLGKENEARILRLELRRELVRQVVLRTLASLGGARSSATPVDAS